MVYLISKGQIKLKNEFIRGHEKWVLIAYPGKPLKQHIYLHQKNFFKFDNPKNIYQNSWYDLKEKSTGYSNAIFMSLNEHTDKKNVQEYQDDW